MNNVVNGNKYHLFALLIFLFGVILLGIEYMTYAFQWKDYRLMAYVGSFVVGVVGVLTSLQALVKVDGKTKTSLLLLVLNGLLLMFGPMYMVLGVMFFGP